MLLVSEFARRRLVLFVALAAIAVGSPSAVRAGCNLIPAAIAELRSTTELAGSVVTTLVNRPVGSPGDAVDLLADLGGCNASGPGFAPDPGALLVTLTFTSPAAGNPVTVVGPLAEALLEPLECGPTDCNRLRLTLPETGSIAATDADGTPLTTPPTGLAGPVEIRVERSGAGVVALVGPLFLPSSGCVEPANETPEPDFGHFTYLPAPQVLVEGTQPAPGVLGSVDGYRSLVLPLDFGTGIAGDPDRGVLLAPAGTPNATLFEIEVLALSSVDAVFSFNPLGRPIPPLLSLTGNKLIASSDVRFSLLQVRPSDPASFTQLMRVDSLGRPTGPAAIPGVVTARTVAPLDSLRATLGLVALTADEALQGGDFTADGDAEDLSPVYLDLAGGVIEESGDAAATLRTSPGVPVIAASGGLVAYALSEAASVEAAPGFGGDWTGNGDAFEDVLRVRRANGAGFDDLTGATATPLAPEPILNGRSLVVNEDAFFVTDEATAAPRTTIRVSEGGGLEGDGESANPATDAAGRRVVWDSAAGNFPGANGRRNVYLTDRDAPGAPTLLSATSGGGGANADSSRPALAEEGTQVAYQSRATDLVGSGGDAAVWERGSLVFGAAVGTFGFAGFVLEPGPADVAGVDYGPCTDPFPGLELVFADPPEENGTGTFDALLVAEFGCFTLHVAGGYAVTPFPLEEGSTITLEGAVTSFTGEPPLPAELSELRFRSTLLVTDTGGGPGFDFDGDFDLLAGGGGAAPGEVGQIYARALVPGSPHALVSANMAGEAGDGDSEAASLDAAGRLVAFASDAANLVADDTNGRRDVFLVDRDADEDGHFDGSGAGERAIVRVSETALGAQVSGDSDQPALAAGGGFVAFTSDAPGLVPGDGNGAADVFVVPVLAAGGPPGLGAPERVSVRKGGSEAHGDSHTPSLSDDGSVVAFVSDAPDLVDGDGNGSSDVFVVERSTGEVERVSVTQGGAERSGDSFGPALSGDGRFVVFTSFAALVPDDDNGLADVYRVDRRRGAIERVSVGSQADGASGAAALSGDGRSAFFDSLAENLVGTDGNGARDVFGRVYGAGASLNPADADAEDLVLQVFRGDGAGLGAGVRTAVASVSVRGSRAVVLTPERDEGGTNLNAGSPLAASPDQDVDDSVAQLVDASSDTRINLGVAAVHATLDEIVCLAVPEAGEGQGGTDLTNDGDFDDDVLVVGRLLGSGGVLSGVALELVPVPVGQVAALGSRCVFQRLETPGNDWNGDGDFLDAVLFVYDDTLGGAPIDRLVGSGRSAAGFTVAPDASLVGFPVCEVDEGDVDLNRDGDRDDCVEHVADLTVTPAPLLAVSNTERQTIACTGVDCDRFTGVAQNGTVSFLGTEPGQAYGAGCAPSIDPVSGCDQDGNLAGHDTVRYVARIVDGEIVRISVQFVSPGDPPGPAVEGPSGTVWRQSKTECDAARIVCPETRDRFPHEVVGGFLSVESSCERTFDLDRTDAGLDCVTLRPWFVGDRDLDGNDDNVDNCQSVPNANQSDAIDGDQLGDLCDGFVSPPPRTCDANLDGFIDQTDVDRIFAARGQVAQGGAGDPDDGVPPADLRDPDEDGLITVNDAGACVARCDLPDCEEQPEPIGIGSATGGGCGLIGLEPLALLWLLARRRRS